METRREQDPALLELIHHNFLKTHTWTKRRGTKLVPLFFFIIGSGYSYPVYDISMSVHPKVTYGF